MRCLLAVCADSAVVDQSNNRLSLFNIIDDLSIQQFPALFTRLTPVFLVEREEGDPELFNAAIVITQGANELGRIPVDANFSGRPRLRLLPQIQGLVVPVPGEIRVTLRQGEIELGHWAFSITQVLAAEPEVVQA